MARHALSPLISQLQAVMSTPPTVNVSVFFLPFIRDSITCVSFPDVETNGRRAIIARDAINLWIFWLPLCLTVRWNVKVDGPRWNFSIPCFVVPDVSMTIPPWCWPRHHRRLLERATSSTSHRLIVRGDFVLARSRRFQVSAAGD